MKIVEIVIDKNGKMSIEGKGFEGTECEKHIKAIEESLVKAGIQMGQVEEKKKPEYYHRVMEKERAR